MRSSKFIYYFSIALRGFTLFSKFAFIILLAKLLQPNDLGIYGLISASVGYAIFAVGFEFYTYSTREIISSPSNKLFVILKNQSIFYLISYLFYMPIFIAIAHYDVLPEGSIWWFITILFFEHVSQEINRILITLNSQVFASFVLFIRQGLWCWLVIMVMFIYPELRTIKAVYILWLLGTMCASLIGILYIFKIKEKDRSSKINYGWIKRGFILSTPMLIAALALRGFFTFDRFVIEKIAGLEVLGAYTLFISMTAAIQSFLDTILISFSFPYLAKLCHLKMYKEFKIEMKKFAIKLIVIVIALCIGCFCTGLILVKWLAKIEYQELLPLFILLIISTFIYCLSLIPHLGLYALRKDRAIVSSQCSSFILFGFFLFLAINYNDINFVIYGMMICFVLLLSLKSIAFIKNINEINSSI